MKKISEIFMYVLGTMIALAFFMTIYFLIFRAIPEGNKSLVEMALGVEFSSFTLIVGYYWGSSKGSSEKNDLLMNSTPTTPK